MSRTKYRIYKYAQRWYGECRHCSRVLDSTRWSGTFGLLTLHAEEHQLLTATASRLHA